jgi:hypothetical protein
VGIFHVTTRLEFSDGAGGTLDIPVKFKITRDGTSSIECQAVLDSLQTDVISLAPELQQLNRRLLKTATAVTDNCPAAKCTRKLLAEKKHEVFDELRALHGQDHSSLLHTIREIHGVNCLNHSHNLFMAAWFKHQIVTQSNIIQRERCATCMQRIWRLKREHQRERHPVISGNRAHILKEAVTVIEPHAISNLIFAYSKIFATDGDHFEYYLNESIKYRVFKQEIPLDAELPHHPVPVEKIPSHKTSRQCWEPDCAYAMVLNHDEDLRYLFHHAAQPKIFDDGKTRESNALVDCVLRGLMCKFAYAAVISEVNRFFKFAGITVLFLYLY